MRKNHNKLFYGRYTHKVVFNMPCADWLWPTTEEHLDKILTNPEEQMSQYFKFSDNKNTRKYIMQLRAMAYVIKKCRRQMKFRIQDNEKIIIYANEKLTSELITAFWDEWCDCIEVNKSFYSKLDPRTVLCSRLPHKKYQYQVWMKRGIYIANDQLCKNLGSYLLEKPDVGRASNSYQELWLKGKSDYDGSGYFYISDEKCLTPIHMILGNKVDKIVKFVKI